MSAATPLAVGMYVTAPGGVTGRIVDRAVHHRDVWFTVKTKAGNIYQVRGSKLTPR